ncbi:MAG: EAL domain-containing protein [Candidatus Accumulibacter sp.]|uniref:bifunctional diguanylate cyclase/phosphodiesterase n=1 Tax=Accumulibacter sp. TaxID=2053492 RepID=UPI00258DE4A1|nr:EAL domain-containing protein [Accumulibacter sp.]MBK8116795.1 EAL domain-containing protein [Accumulibacter sp.]
MNIMATAHNSLDRQLLGDLDTASPWAAILDQLGLAIAVLNADLGFLRVTRQFAAATGATPDFFLGRQYFEVFPQPVVEAIFRQVRDSGIAHVHTARPFLPKLSPILGISYWNWSLTPFSDGEGAHPRRTQYLVLTMQDVSAPLNSEIRARRGEAELRTLLDHLPGMTYRAAADWSSDILLNCEALTGYTAAEINALPEKWLSLIHPDDVASVVVDCERLRTGPQQATLNYRIIDRNGNSRWIEDRKISLFAGDGSFLGVEGIAVDSAAATARERGRGFSDPHYRSLIEAAFDELTARKQAEASLRASESRFRRLFESMTSGFALHEIVLDAEGKPCDYRFIDVNPAFEAITGLARADTVGRCVRELLPNIEPHWIERYGAVALTGDGQQFDDFSSDLDRQYRVTVYRPEPQQFAVIVDDITALRRHEESLRQAATVFEQTRDGVAITDASARIIAVNRAFSKITGYSSEEVVGRNTSLLKSGHHDAAFYAAMWSQLTGKGFWEGEVCNRRKNGEHYPQWLTISAVLNERNEIERYIGVFTDISRIRNAEAHAEFIAYHDALTRLPNRSLLNIRYQHALDRARRHDHKLALLILDLDLFRNINDSLGHEFGDRLLVAITERFKSRLRDEDTLARLHGDEFAVLMEDVEVSADAAVVARDLLKALEAPFRIGSAEDIYIGASIGISISPDDGCDPALLMRNADTAVNLAKAQGRKTFCFYTESLTTLALERMRLESSLRKAIELEHLVLHYQPLIEARTGAVIGSEALVRWPDPEQGMIAPMRFIPVAEDCGLIAPLGAWVLLTACRQMKAWLDAGRPLRTIAVNVSPRQFFLQDVPELVRQTLADTGLDARFLELEITEGILIEHGERAVAILKRLRELGVRLSIDDFGTGYSSLSYLKRFPIDKLKIDRSFVRDITSDANAAEIASTIIAMARSLQLSVLAEGVETPAQLAFLERHGCEYYQGYFFCRPVAAAQFPESCPVTSP